MLITTTETIPGKNISEILGIARGSTVRARNVGKDIFAAFKNLVGGEIEEYTKLQAAEETAERDRKRSGKAKAAADAADEGDGSQPFQPAT